MNYSIYNLTTGLFSGVIIMAESHSLDQNVPDGCSAMLGEFNHLTQCVDLSNSAVIDYVPPKPVDDVNQTWVLDETSKLWVSTPTLFGLQGAKWDAIQATRATLETGNFTVDGKVYQINKLNFAGAALDALFAIQSNETTWTEDWILFDNTTVTLTAQQLIVVARACAAVISALYDISQTLRTSIYATTQPTQLDSISWPA